MDLPVLKLLMMMFCALGAAVIVTLVSAAEVCPPLERDAALALTGAQVRARVAVCHPDVIAADRALAGAVADVITAGQGANPQLTVGAGTINPSAYGSGSAWQKTFDHQLRIDQLIERGGKPALREAVAPATLAAGRADRAEAQRLSGLAAQKLLIDLASALAKRAQTQATVGLNEESARMIDRRVRAGDAAALDATRLGLDALRVRADLEQATADVQALRLQLAQAIGAPALAEEITPAPQTLTALVPALRPDTAARRPDAVAAQARVTAAEAALELARAQTRRDVSVGVQLDHYPTSLANTSGTGNTVSVSLSVPLFLRHGHEGETARADADLYAARELLRRVQATADSDLARAQSQWRAASARRALAAEQMEPAAERVAAGAELAYQRGASPVLDVLEARRSLRAARAERIAADADLAKAAAELEAASQPIDVFLP